MKPRISSHVSRIFPILELNPRGQVAPQVYVDNCDATNETDGGRWRRSRHLRRVQRPRQCGTENGSSRRLMPGGTPFFERSFHEITNEFCSESVQKLVQKKLNTQQHQQTDRQTGLADLEQLWDHALDSQNADTSRKTSKSCLQNRL